MKNQIRHKLGLPYCKTCSQPFNDKPYKNCVVCRIEKAMQLFNWRAGQKAGGLCANCVERSNFSRENKKLNIRCQEHLRYQAEYNLNRYWNLRAKGVCTANCGTKTASVFCDECKILRQKRKRKIKRVA